jgi:hypothetical protein
VESLTNRQEPPEANACSRLNAVITTPRMGCPMQISDAKIIRELTDINHVNALIINEKWRLLAVVPGYDHLQAKPVALYVLGREDLPSPGG